MAAPRRRAKAIFDPIHGPISLSGVTLELVGTATFQRLWGIRQTGFAHLVFPGANHTRLEHSLGTYWVAHQMAERLRLAPSSVQRVEVAALLHDVGHAPFSHTLDGPMREACGVDHERVSRNLIEGRVHLEEETSTTLPDILREAGLRPSDVADLVDPGRRRPKDSLAGSVLHGAIDADRLDYLQRDAHYTGVAHGAIDAGRLLETLRVDGRRAFFAEKGRSAVEGFLVGRALMYASVYYHKTVRAAEMMAQAAVERSPGFPSAARELFALTDAELLVALTAAGGLSARLARGLRFRRLFKRVRTIAQVPRARHARWKALLESPPSRRQAEDELAARLRSAPGTVLLDLGGLDPRGDAARDWSSVGVGEPGAIRFPFRPEGPWRALVLRPPSDWAVSVYVAPELRRRAEARLTERTLLGLVD